MTCPNLVSGRVNLKPSFQNLTALISVVVQKCVLLLFFFLTGQDFFFPPDYKSNSVFLRLCEI